MPDTTAERRPTPSDSERLRVVRRPGEAIPRDRSRLWQLVRGEIVIQAAGRPVEIWRAPGWFDAAGVYDGLGAIAVTEVELEGTRRDAVSEAALADAMRDEARRLWSRVEADAIREDDTFLPWGEPVPGPWWFRRVSAIALVVEGDPRRIAACLPRRVRSLPGTAGRFVVAVSRFEGVSSIDARDTREFTYHEVTPFLPVWSGLRGPAAFVPELYPDASMAVLLGREILGFPKRLARVGFHDDGAELLVDRALALRVRWRSATPIAPADALARIAGDVGAPAVLARAVGSFVRRWPTRLGFAAIVHKRIGAPSSAGKTFEIDRLVRVPIALDPVSRADALVDLEAELGPGPGILHGRVISGFRLFTGFHFGRGRRERELG